MRMVSNRIRTWLGALSVFLIPAAMVVGSSVSAQTPLPVQQFRQSETAIDDFAISRPNDIGDMQLSVHGHVDYANDPLVLELNSPTSGNERAAIVADQISAQIGLSLGLFNRLVLFVGLPVNLMQDNDDNADKFNLKADGAGLGDVYFGARLRLWGENDDPFSIALQASMTGDSAPSRALGGRDNGMLYSGDKGLTGHSELLAEYRMAMGLRITANVGFRLRFDRLDNDRTIGPTALVAGGNRFEYDHEVTYGLGLAMPIWQCSGKLNRVDALVQVYGATATNDFFSREHSPLEWLAGLKLHHQSGFTAGLGGGMGISRGYGSPDFRLLGMLGWAMGEHQAAPEPEPEPAPEPEPEPVVLDGDNDGLNDDVDQCPAEAEDIDGFEDENGCPDPDNDGDGVLDVNDKAPNEAEDVDGFEDEDGAPELDNDGDGIADTTDKCPNEAEDMDHVADADGCPEEDPDGDKIADKDDHCPMTAGVKNKKKPECNGCPKLACVDETGSIVILKRVEFASGKDKILRRSERVLKDVQSIVAANTDIRRIRVEGHTDDKGKDSRNMDLSRRRAASVMKWLVDHGINAERIEAWGCGEIDPRADNKKAKGRAENRRVEFHITEPHPEKGKVFKADCQRAEGVKPKDKDSGEK